MKVTKLQVQVKNSDRISVYVDEKYSFSLNQSQLLSEKLFVGKEVDETELTRLRKLSDFGKAFDRILRFIAIRSRSQREIEQYCRKKDISVEDCQVIIERLASLGYVNDDNFAKSWVRSRAVSKPVSKRRLQTELIQKGISSEQREEALGEYDELAALEQIINKKLRLTRYKNDKQKLIAYLQRQGFRFDDIQKILNTDYSFDD